MIGGEPLAHVTAEFRTRPRSDASAPAATAAAGFAVTIADLVTFAAATYPTDLQRWARAAVDAPSTGAA